MPKELYWTDERIKLLQRLWADGFSASEIAVVLGGITRNVVIGRIHRMRLSGRVRFSASSQSHKSRKLRLASPSYYLDASDTRYPSLRSKLRPAALLNPQRPYLVMIAGPNGSGKTTLTDWLRQQRVDFGEYINADDIASRLRGSYDTRIAEAQVIADESRKNCIIAKRNFSFETVMSHPSKVEILTQAKAAGFFVQLLFIGTDDPIINVDRVALRVTQGGHDVPIDRIIARWYRTMELLNQAITVADRTLLFDNSAAAQFWGGIQLVFVYDSMISWEIRLRQHFPPVPTWVQEYVLKRLNIGPFGVDTDF